jgi:predicted nucleic acid-binding protein
MTAQLYGLAPAPSVELLIDTNIVSYIFKETALGTAYARLIDGRATAITLLSIAELSAGVSRGRWGYEKVERLDALVSRFVPVPGTAEVANLCGVLLGRCREIGRAMDWPDAWAAATAIWLDVPLVTHDRDVEGVPGLRVVTLHDEWQLRDGSFGAFASTPLVLRDGSCRRASVTLPPS